MSIHPCCLMLFLMNYLTSYKGQLLHFYIRIHCHLLKATVSIIYFFPQHYQFFLLHCVILIGKQMYCHFSLLKKQPRNQNSPPEYLSLSKYFYFLFPFITKLLKKLPLCTVLNSFESILSWTHTNRFCSSHSTKTALHSITISMQICKIQYSVLISLDLSRVLGSNDLSSLKHFSLSLLALNITLSSDFPPTSLVALFSFLCWFLLISSASVPKFSPWFSFHLFILTSQDFNHYPNSENSIYYLQTRSASLNVRLYLTTHLKFPLG